MANTGEKHLLNTPGDYFVDNGCMDCGLCGEAAPLNFSRVGETGAWYVSQQPASRNEEARCEEAMLCCPANAIGRELTPAETVTDAAIDVSGLEVAAGCEEGAGPLFSQSLELKFTTGRYRAEALAQIRKSLEEDPLRRASVNLRADFGTKELELLPESLKHIRRGAAIAAWHQQLESELRAMESEVAKLRQRHEEAGRALEKERARSSLSRMFSKGSEKQILAERKRLSGAIAERPGRIAAIRAFARVMPKTVEGLRQLRRAVLNYRVGLQRHFRLLSLVCVQFRIGKRALSCRERVASALAAGNTQRITALKHLADLSEEHPGQNSEQIERVLLAERGLVLERIRALKRLGSWLRDFQD